MSDTPPTPPPGQDVRPAVVEELLGLVCGIDELHAKLLRLLCRLIASGEVEDQTGLSVELWLGLVGRMPIGDRRTLLTAADVLATMPAFASCVAEGAVSWGQTRRVILACRTLSNEQRAEADEPIAGMVFEYADCEPEVLPNRVDDLVYELRSVREAAAEQREVETRFVAMQPRLDGSGGRLWGDFDAVGFATIDEALSARMQGPAGLEASRGSDGASIDDAVARNRAALGRQRGDALVAMAAESLGGDGKPARPLLLATVDLATLLGLDHAPGRLLHHLTGGTLRVTADAARQLADEGCDLRLLVTTNGSTIGVGRKARLAPGWLRDASLAAHATCVEPGCQRSARTCDLDHAHAWSDNGPTDLDNLAPLCRPGHTTKTHGHTTLSRGSPHDRTRWWTHTRTGIRIKIPPD